MVTINTRLSYSTATDFNSHALPAFTPPSGELLVVGVGAAQSVLAVPQLTSSDGTVFVLAKTVGNVGSNLYVFVADSLTTGAAMTLNYNCTGDSATGGNFAVVGLGDMTLTGLRAVQQVVSSTGLAGTTPAGTFPAAVNTASVTLGFVYNGANPAGLSPPTGWTELGDTGHPDPVRGLEWVGRLPGFTGTTITWAASSATQHAEIILDIDPRVPPTTVLNTASGTAFGAVTTPTLEMTGTASTGLPVEYYLELSQDSTFATYQYFLSSTPDPGFVNTVNGGNTHPFTSGQKVAYAIQSALASGTWHWRAAASDPAGVNEFGPYSAARTFTVGAGTNTPPTVVLNTPNAMSTTDTTPTLEMTGTDPEGNKVRYNVQIATDAAFTTGLLDRTSGTNAGFASQDTFDDNLFSTSAWTRDSATQIVEVNQRLEMSSILAGNYAKLTSRHFYDMTGIAASLQVVDAGNQSLVSWQAYPLILAQNVNNSLFFMIANGQLSAEKTIAGVRSALIVTPYSQSAHQYLRIRESAGTTYWETSGDRVTWTVLFSQVNPGPVTSLRVEALVGTYQAEATTTTAKFNDVKVTVPDLYGSGDQVGFTVQAADTLAAGTWYWRARATDPAGTNTWSAFTASRTFTVTAAGSTAPTVVLNTAGGFDYGTDSTPTVEFTGSDADGDPLNYEIQISSTSAFTGAGTASADDGTFTEAGTAGLDDGTFAAPGAAALDDGTFGGSGVLITRNSVDHPGFQNTADSADVSPFTAGQKVTYTVRAADALNGGGTYWWRVRVIDPAGTNTYSAYTASRTFTVTPVETQIGGFLMWFRDARPRRRRPPVVQGTPPVAAFTWTADGLVATFDSSGSSDADGTIVKRVWNFGDGTGG